MFGLSNRKVKSPSLRDFWSVEEVKDGFLLSKEACGFMFRLSGLDISFFSEDNLQALNDSWRSALRIPPDDEVQIIFRKRVHFADWINEQLSQSFLAENPYGRRILLSQLASQVAQMGAQQPKLLSERIVLCYWTKETRSLDALKEKRVVIQSILESFGMKASSLGLKEIEKEIHASAQDLNSSEENVFEWPSIKLEAGQLQVNDDCFRALELVKLPESFSQLGMIQSLTKLPFPIDVSVRLQARDMTPIIKKLERKRNLLHGKRSNKASPSQSINSQIEQIDEVLHSIASKSEAIFNLQVCIGIRLPKEFKSFHRSALTAIQQAAAQMNFCELQETTLDTFDTYLECIPGFRGENITSHTVLGSNAIHFLPFFRPARGDDRAVVSFQTRANSLYSIDPVDEKVANYNWLVSGTSGSGKSFFINSLIAQSSSMNPNVFIIDIGGSYNKLTRFLGGEIMSLEPGEGFELSPFFLEKSSNETEERMRRQHIYKVFLEMTRIDNQLPSIEVRHLLSELLNEIFEKESVPEKPISYMLQQAKKLNSPESSKLALLLEPWTYSNFLGQFLDNNKTVKNEERILAFDLKGLTEFEDLSRVVQLILCASLWAKIRSLGKERFSWIVLDEVAFSLLKTQPEFVDELVSTLRKYYAGAIIIVQDLEKVTSNLAGSSILQNTHSKAILQQCGSPKNYSEVLSLRSIDQMAIKSLRREKGAYSEIFLIRGEDRIILRHIPSSLEYWLATTAPEDVKKLNTWLKDKTGKFQSQVLNFLQTSHGGL